MSKKKNFLDFIPVRNEEYSWSIDKDIVTVEVIRNGFYDKIAQKLFKKPKRSFIKLDEYGSFVWQCIDNESSIGEIALKLKDKFNDEDKLYERIVMFFNILKNNNFVKFKN